MCSQSAGFPNSANRPDGHWQRCCQFFTNKEMCFFEDEHCKRKAERSQQYRTWSNAFSTQLFCFWLLHFPIQNDHTNNGAPTSEDSFLRKGSLIFSDRSKRKEQEGSAVTNEAAPSMDAGMSSSNSNSMQLHCYSRNKKESTEEAIWKDALRDPHKWPLLVNAGPVQTNCKDFPLDIDEGKYPAFHFPHQFSKKEQGSCLYSASAVSVYCFCCKLFNSRDFVLSRNGVQDFKNILNSLVKHEKSAERASIWRETYKSDWSKIVWLIKKISTGLFLW